MNVCFFSHAPNLTGANKSLINLINELKKKNVKALVILPKHGIIEEALIENDIDYKVIRNYSLLKKKNEVFNKRIVKLVVKRSINSIALIRLLWIIKVKKIDIIHNNSLATYIGGVVAKFTKIPTVWHIREFLEEDHGFEFINKKEMQNLLESSDEIIMISNSIKEYFLKKYSFKKINLIYNGIPSAEYIYKRAHVFEKEIINIILLGRLVEGKGQLEALIAINILLERGIDNFKLYIVGSGLEKDDYENKLYDYIKENSHIANYVEFIPFTLDTKELRIRTDLALVCSIKEAFGRVTIEAMLANQLVIASNTGGTLELINDFETGILYEQGDSNDLAEKIEWSMKHRIHVRKIVEASFNHSLLNFSIENTADKIYEVYGRIK